MAEDDGQNQEAFEDVASSADLDDPQLLPEWADRRYTEGGHEEAVEAYHKALRLDDLHRDSNAPEALSGNELDRRFRILRGLGECYYGWQNWPRSRDYFDRAADLAYEDLYEDHGLSDEVPEVLVEIVKKYSGCFESLGHAETCASYYEHGGEDCVRKAIEELLPELERIIGSSPIAGDYRLDVHALYSFCRLRGTARALLDIAGDLRRERDKHKDDGQTYLDLIKHLQRDIITAGGGE